MKKRIPHLWKYFVCLALGTLLLIMFFNPYFNPILIIRSDPNSNVYIDGQVVQFSADTAVLHPWKWTYLVQVQGSNRSISRRIYPWDQKSDSGSIEVKKSGEVVFNLANAPTD